MSRMSGMGEWRDFKRGGGRRDRLVLALRQGLWLVRRSHARVSGVSGGNDFKRGVKCWIVLGLPESVDALQEQVPDANAPALPALTHRMQ